jgi:hypothetical protein
VARAAALLIAALLAGACGGAGAARAQMVQRMFEPTDMELEDPGTAEIDMQFGPVRGEDEGRFSLPDFEIDLGLTRQVELDIDGEYAIGGGRTSLFALSGPAPDNLWTALKFDLPLGGLADGYTLTAGLQLGPKFPIAPDAAGVGFQGLLLLGIDTAWDATLVLNFGGLVDPHEDVDTPRPQGILAGIDLAVPLDEDWTVNAGIAGATYFSPDPTQFDTSAGIAYEVFDDGHRCAVWHFCALEVSLTGVYGWLHGGDQYGVLLGISPKFKLWDSAS